MSQSEKDTAAHIAELEHRLETLAVRFMSESDSELRRSIQREMFAVQTALDHHRSSLAQPYQK